MVRTRFAPSPTGKLHVGNVRTALFAWLYARHAGGKFVLRIEDTDLERSHEDFTKILMNDLRWLGLDWDEGPEAGGPEKSYYQSERLGIYREYADKLIAEGRAYHCYCTPEEVEADKARLAAEGKPPHYSGRCRHLSDVQKRKFETEGRKPVIRFIAYDEDFSFRDLVKGPVQFPKGMVGDFVIMRANGVPVYNYAVVIDDALMQITHVMRADEHLSNTVRQLMIYKAFGFQIPEFAHMALILGPDHQKLSKRHGATSVEEFRNLGYLPESVINALLLLGWSHPEGKEIMPVEEMIAAFDLDRLSPSPAVFDMQKLDWIAKHYVMNAPMDRIFELAKPWLLEAGVPEAEFADPAKNKFYRGVVELTRGYCAHLSDLRDHVDYFIHDNYPVTEDAMAALHRDSARKVLIAFRRAVETETRPIDETAFLSIADSLKKSLSVKGKELFMPLRAALTGRAHGPEIYHLMPVIGKDRTLARIDRAIALCGEPDPVQTAE